MLSLYALSFFLIFTRWISLILIAPIMGSRVLPTLIKVGLASLFSIITFLLLKKSLILPIHINTLSIMLLFLKEALVGFILGFFLSLIFFIYELSGQWMDFGRSASAMIQMVPSLESQSSILGNLMFYFSLSIFFALGLHEKVLSIFLESFFSWPLFSLPKIATENFWHLFISLSQNLFKMALVLSLPVIAFSFLLDLSFGLLNRLVPEINAYFLSLPVKVLMGLIILFLCLPSFIEKIIYFNQANYFRVENSNLTN